MFRALGFLNSCVWRPSWIVSMATSGQNDVTTYFFFNPSSNLLSTFEFQAIEQHKPF